MSKNNDDDWMTGLLLLGLLWFLRKVLGGIPPIVIPRKDKNGEGKTPEEPSPEDEPLPSPEPTTPIDEPRIEPKFVVPPFVTLPDIRDFEFIDEPIPEPEPIQAPYQSPYETPTYKAPGITTNEWGLLEIETTPEMISTANLLTGAALLPVEPIVSSLSQLFGNILKNPKTISPFVTPVSATEGTPIQETNLIVGEPTTPQQAEFEEFFEEATLPLIR